MSMFAVIFRQSRITTSQRALEIQPVVPRNEYAMGMWTKTSVYSFGFCLNFIVFKPYNMQRIVGSEQQLMAIARTRTLWLCINSIHSRRGVVSGMGKLVRFVETTARMLAIRQIKPQWIEWCFTKNSLNFIGLLYYIFLFFWSAYLPQELLFGHKKRIYNQKL